MGLLVGAWQGFWVAYVGIPAFIVTLAGMLLFRGLTLQVLDNISLSPFPPEYSKIASGFLNGLLGGDGYDAFTLLIVRRRGRRLRRQPASAPGWRGSATTSRSSPSRCSSPRSSLVGAVVMCLRLPAGHTPAACRSC